MIKFAVVHVQFGRNATVFIRAKDAAAAEKEFKRRYRYYEFVSAVPEGSLQEAA